MHWKDSGRRRAQATFATLVGLTLLATLSGCASKNAPQTVAAAASSSPTPDVTGRGVAVKIVLDSNAYQVGDNIAATVQVTNETGHPVTILAGTCASWLDFGLVKPGSSPFVGGWPDIACKPSELPEGESTINVKVSTTLHGPGIYQLEGVTGGQVQSPVTFSNSPHVSLQP